MNALLGRTIADLSRAEPLANPGKVIRQLRGSDTEHLAAAGSPAKPKAKEAPALKPKPRPRRASLDKAEKRLENAEADRARENEAFEREKAVIREREDAARRAFNATRSRLEADLQAHCRGALSVAGAAADHPVGYREQVLEPVAHLLRDRLLLLQGTTGLLLALAHEQCHADEDKPTVMSAKV